VGTATGPETPGATGAQGLKGDKGDPGGIVDGTWLSTTDLNLLTTSGEYRSGGMADATLERNYPVANVYGKLMVRAITTTLVVQEFTPIGGSDVGRVFYRRLYSSGGWQPWRAYGAQRVDQTAGRAIYTWDDVNNREQLVYGDTGWRAVALDPTIGVVAAGDFWGRPSGGGSLSADAVLLRRINNIVYIGSQGALQPKQDYSGTTRNIILLPAGWRATGTGEHMICKYGNNGGDAGQRLAFVLPGATYANPPALQATPMLDMNWNGRPTGEAYPKLYHGLWLTGQYTTPDAWPTTLPGVAFGIIPNA
jgi:hypothetical protein